MGEIKRCAFCGTSAHKFKSAIGTDVIECLNKKCGVKCHGEKEWNNMPREPYTDRPLPDMYNRYVEDALSNLSKTIKSLEDKFFFYRFENMEKEKNENVWPISRVVFVGVPWVLLYFYALVWGMLEFYSFFEGWIKND